MIDKRKVINDLIVLLFNNVLIIEEKYFKEKGIKSLSINEIHVIEAIYEDKEKTMTSVANRLMVTIGTLTTSISRIEKKGFVIRKKDDADRRIVRISLTEMGEIVNKIHTGFHDFLVNNILENIKPEEDEVLIKSLGAISNFINRMKEQYTTKYKGE